MKTVHILNPVAGRGKAKKNKALSNAYMTKYKEDATRFVKDSLAQADTDIRFCVYGGDGTVREAVSGIVQAKTDKAYLTVVPVGTGNDLARSINENPEDVITADVLTVNGRYAINAINTGFDLKAVERANAFRRAGPLAYPLGVISALMSPLGRHMKIEYIDKDGNAGKFESDCLLMVAANGKYYGGGFKASPAAELTDGFIDLMIVKKVSRLKFISLVTKYRKGLHIDVQNQKPIGKFSDILIYRKCKNIKITGIKKMCMDGDIFDTDIAEIGIIPHALKIMKYSEA